MLGNILIPDFVRVVPYGSIAGELTGIRRINEALSAESEGIGEILVHSELCFAVRNKV